MHTKPRAYDINNVYEIHRLHLEVMGYLLAGQSGVCPHCHKIYREGTDFKGREFAIAALKEMTESWKQILGLTIK